MNTSTEAVASRARSRKRALWGLVLLFALLALGYLVYWVLIGRFYVTTDDAYVRGNLVTLTARVPGTVTSIAADNTELVSAGEPVVVLDPTTARLRLRSATSALALAVRKARALRARLRSLQASREAAYALYQEALGDERRRRRLLPLHAISREVWQHSVAKAAALKARYLAARAAADGVAAEIGTGPIAHLPTIRKAAAAVAFAYADLARCIVRAPVSGYVAKRSVQLGQHVIPGRPLMVIIPLHQLWVTANFKENEIGSLRLGQSARVVAEIYGSSVVYRGHVIGIGAGTGSAFALLPPSNATGNWINIVQRIPVRVSLPRALLDRHPLRVGLTATVTVNIHNKSGDTLASHPRPGFLYHTRVYGHSDAKARELIHRILIANGARRG